MTTIRSNQKASDAEIIRLNSLGYSLKAIGKRLGCHPTTVAHRLKDLGVEAANTRRAFMEVIYDGLPQTQVEWLADQLGPHLSIHAFVKNLLVNAYARRHSKENP